MPAIADLLGVDADEIKLGPNMTTLTFHVSRSIAATLRPGDEIVVTGLDHQANIDPWIAAARDSEAIVRTWEPQPRRLHPRPRRRSTRVLNERTRLVAVGWASNAVGTINPVREIAERVPTRPALAVRRRRPRRAAPAARRAGGRCRLRRLLGLQVLRAAPRRRCTAGATILDALPAYKVRPARDRFETGTGNFEGDAGAAAAVEYLADVGARRTAARRRAHPRRERVARRDARDSRLRAGPVPPPRRTASRRVDGVRILGLTADADMERRTPTAAITIDGRHAPRGVAEALGRAGHRRVGRRLLRDGLIERLGPRARRRRPDRADPLQHARRGRPARSTSWRAGRRLTERLPPGPNATGSCRSCSGVDAPIRRATARTGGSPAPSGSPGRDDPRRVAVGVAPVARASAPGDPLALDRGTAGSAACRRRRHLLEPRRRCRRPAARPGRREVDQPVAARDRLRAEVTWSRTCTSDRRRASSLGVTVRCIRIDASWSAGRRRRASTW